MSLRTKFNIASAFLILTIVVGMMGSLIVFERRRLREDIVHEQRQDLAKLERVCRDTMGFNPDEPAFFNYAQKLVYLSAPRVAYVGIVYDAPNRDSWVYLASGALIFLDPAGPEVAQVRNTTGDDQGVVERDVVFRNTELREMSKPVYWKKDRIGFVRLAYSREVIRDIYRKAVLATVRRVTVVGLIAIGVGIVLASFFSVRLSRPIVALMRAAESIATGKKGIQIPVSGRDEMGRLTKTFNHMSEELTKLDQLKDDFMSHVTHELRSPLTSIIATAELMAEMPTVEKDPKLKRSVDRLMYGSERLNKLVDNILDLMRLEAGKMSFDIQPIDICRILIEMADFFEVRANEKNLSIKAVLPSAFPLVSADPERIRQVLSNLIYNAIKFTNRGSITLWVKEVNGMAQVGVQDTGVGIPKEKLSQLFQKFSTLRDTRDRVDKPVPGSGLGLNIVQNSVKAQGGDIWVESVVDQGSAFIFSLPLAPATAKLRATTSVPQEVIAPPPTVAVETKRAI